MMIVPGLSLLLIVQVTAPPSGTETVAPNTSWKTGELVAELKSRTFEAVAAAADKVKSLGSAEPPSLLVTVLTSFRVGVLSLLLSVQMTAPPSGTEMVAPAWVPKSQLQEPAE